jgi:hypothetical protein
LNERPRKPQPDPLRKIRFREAARDIVAKDRYDRRDGRAVDTAGAVARALERAYGEGFADAQSEPRTPDILIKAHTISSPSSTRFFRDSPREMIE